MSVTGRLGALAAGAVLVCMGQTQQKVTPFAEFIRGVKHAEAQQFLHKPGAEVKDTAAFEQMREYILKLYEGVHVQRSYIIGTQTVDCVPESEQPSVRAQRTKEIAAPPPIPVSPPDDTKRAVSAQGCGTGTIPMRRITLEELTRFQTLDDYLHKAPHGRAPMPPSEKKP